MDAAQLLEGQKVSIVNINNGERLDTYLIPGQRGAGEVTLNGPAARKVQKGDLIINYCLCINDRRPSEDLSTIDRFPE